VRERGVTIVLVTHLMEEAERLCDRVALIDRGRVLALGSPDALGQQAAINQRVRLTVPGPHGEAALRALQEVTALERHGADLVVSGSGELVRAVVLALHDAGLRAENVRTETASLEDAFLRLTEEAAHDITKPEAER
jgi:ABC-2 type transport system ATP-binding protein